MIGDEPTPKDTESMSNEPLARSALTPAVGDPLAHQGNAAPADRPVEGRRINFLAWGIASVAGIAMWVFILKGL